MSVNVPQSFVTAFTKLVKRDFQQEGSVLRGLFRERKVTDANTVNFHRIGSVTTTQRARHGTIPAQDPTHGQVSITPQDWYSRVLIDNADRLRTNIDLRKEYSQLVAAALGRRLDDIILQAAVAGAGVAGTLSTQIPGVTVDTLTLDSISRTAEFLANQQIPIEDCIWVIPPAGRRQLLAIPEATSVDFVQDRPLPDGMAPKKFLGFRWVESTRLPTSGSFTTSLLVHRMSLGVVYQEEPTIKIERIPQADMDHVLGRILAGAGVIDPAGVLALDLSIA